MNVHLALQILWSLSSPRICSTSRLEVHLPRFWVRRGQPRQVDQVVDQGALCAGWLRMRCRYSLADLVQARRVAPGNNLGKLSIALSGRARKSGNGVREGPVPGLMLPARQSAPVPGPPAPY